MGGFPDSGSKARNYGGNGETGRLPMIEGWPDRMNRVDSDIHNEVPGITTLMPYLSDHWVENFTHSNFRGPFDFDASYPANTALAVRPGSRVDGGPPGLEMVRDQALGPEVGIGILLCTYAIDSLHNPDQAVALARAVNDWQIDQWLDRDPRLRASIVVPSQIPVLAAEEIERVADHAGFVQVALPARSHHPYGSRLFHPMWEAIARRNLVAGIYFGGAPGNPPTAVGWPSYFIEEYVGMAAVFASQMTSIVVEGVFDQFESLRITLLESGSSWLTSHMWRLDKEWKQLRITVPWVRRPPSAYIRDHVRLTIEPWDVPPEDDRAKEIVDHLGSDELLLYGSAYPHQTVGAACHLLETLSAEVSQKVLGDNARKWYGL